MENGINTLPSGLENSPVAAPASLPVALLQQGIIMIPAWAGLWAKSWTLPA
jgi:hypothetical protein